MIRNLGLSALLLGYLFSFDFLLGIKRCFVFYRCDIYQKTTKALYTGFDRRIYLQLKLQNHCAVTIPFCNQKPRLCTGHNSWDRHESQCFFRAMQIQAWGQFKNLLLLFHFLLSPSMPHDKRICLHFKKWECVTNNTRKPEHEFSGIIFTLGRWLADVWFKTWFASIGIKKAITQNTELNSNDNTRKIYLVNYYIGRLKRNETEHSVER